MAFMIQNNPLSFVPYKLFISDINSSNVHLLRKADICGIVCNYSEHPPRVIIEVDDGTGSITCFINCEKLKAVKAYNRLKACDEELKHPNYPDPDEVETLLHLSAEAQKMYKFHMPSTLTQGTCVQVRGFVFESHGEIKMNAFEVFRLTPDREINRMAEMAILYKTLYHQKD